VRLPRELRSRAHEHGRCDLHETGAVDADLVDGFLADPVTEERDMLPVRRDDRARVHGRRVVAEIDAVAGRVDAVDLPGEKWRPVRGEDDERGACCLARGRSTGDNRGCRGDYERSWHPMDVHTR
jgi:hypothetical protein